ncbi:hypothetical protein SPKIRA_16150 [Sphingomonas paucimobilis]|uniref:DNA, contig: SP603 n=1 Tax=Sphingomonas paucimobilis NBRC 13935 TaxID=1219050 RepID=A0A0C9MXG6_SPHPI|nr:hypothetical protein SPKIRA_16150 [Sphingomonas paucimobilis]GAN12074.1 hypothetical protein SP6_03_00100 [Sphingomonas paucimobilis NBRC 13935]
MGHERLGHGDHSSRKIKGPPLIGAAVAAANLMRPAPKSKVWDHKVLETGRAANSLSP